MQETIAQPFDAKAFRAALGTFATGVTVITALGRNGEPIGLTANSFNSVSLDPPLVLWSLAKKAFSLPDFVAARHWAVHVLSAEQESISNQFARGGVDKFAGVTSVPSAHGVPLLQGCAARFECTTTFQYEGGDHIIFVGEVKHFEKNAHPPLVFHAGRYALAACKDAALPAVPLAGAEPLSFRSDMLGYMFGRARRNFLDSMRGHLETYGLSDYEWRLLTILLARKGLSRAMFSQFNQDAAPDTLVQTLDALEDKGWITACAPTAGTEPVYCLTEKGVFDSVSLLAVAKSHEEQLLGTMDDMDGVLLKHLLNKFIQKTEGGSAKLWNDECMPNEEVNG